MGQGFLIFRHKNFRLALDPVRDILDRWPGDGSSCSEPAKSMMVVPDTKLPAPYSMVKVRSPLPKPRTCREHCKEMVACVSEAFIERLYKAASILLIYTSTATPFLFTR